MNKDSFKVNLTMKDTIMKLDAEIIDNSISGERIDHYFITGDTEKGAILLVYEKYFSRVGNRITLTITIDNLEQDGRTKVHTVGGGAAEGVFFKFDWGASEDFASMPRKILSNYIV